MSPSQSVLPLIAGSSHPILSISSSSNPTIPDLHGIRSLYCSKGTKLVVNKLVDEHLVPTLDIPIDGRIVLLHAFRPPVPYLHI